MSQSFAMDPTSPSVQEVVVSPHSFDHLQAALRAGLTATWFWDFTRDILYGDPTLLSMLGVGADQASLPAHLFTDVIHPDDRQRIIGLIDDARRTGSSFDADYRIVTPAPEPVWVFVRGQFTYNQHREPVTFSGILVNVTARKQGEIKASMIEEGLRLAINSAKLGTWNYNLLTGDITWSARTRELFNLPASVPVSYAVFLQCLHPDDRAMTDQLIQQTLQPDSTGQFHHEYRVPGQSAQDPPRWLRSNGQVFFTEARVAYRFMGTVIDITADKQNEAQLQQRVDEQTRALEQQTHQLRTTLNASLNSIIAMTAIRDDSGAITDFIMDTANQAVVQSLAKTPESIVGRTLLSVFPGSKENGFFDLYTRVVNTSESGQATQYYQDDSGFEGWFEVSAVKQDGNSVVITFNNITDRKKNELLAQQQAAELNEAIAELKRSNESLQQFAHIASHDLQEPLRRIQSFSDLLQNQFSDSLSDGEKDMVRRIQKSAARMQALIKDLLFYSQVSTQRDPFTTVSLNDTIDDVLNDLELPITEKKASISVAALPQVRGNASRLRQLFQNLIANSLKFSTAGVAPRIAINFHTASFDELPELLRHTDRQSFWSITVTDNGIGFDARYKDRIFTPFQRLHNPVTYSGTGIGLAICQRVAQNHGGSIDVVSEVGIGSTFRVFLPIPGPTPA